MEGREGEGLNMPTWKCYHYLDNICYAFNYKNLKKKLNNNFYLNYIKIPFHMAFACLTRSLKVNNNITIFKTPGDNEIINMNYVNKHIILLLLWSYYYFIIIIIITININIIIILLLLFY